MIGSLATPGFSQGVAVTGNRADSNSGLQIVNVSNPNAPVIVGAVDTPGEAQDVAVAGSFAYVADYGVPPSDQYLEPSRTGDRRDREPPETLAVAGEHLGP